MVESLFHLVNKDASLKKKKLTKTQLLDFYSSCSEFQSDYDALLTSLSQEFVNQKVIYKKFQNLIENRLTPAGLTDTMKIYKFLREKVQKNEEFLSLTEMDQYLKKAAKLNEHLYTLIQSIVQTEDETVSGYDLKFIRNKNTEFDGLTDGMRFYDMNVFDSVGNSAIEVRMKDI
jgi:hypothetical protein